MPRFVRVLGWLVGGVAALLTAGALAAWWLLRPAVPDPFYAPPAALPSQPGTLLRVEPFAREVPAGAQAWRIVYTTTDTAGAPTLSSAIVMRSQRAPAGPLPVVAWTHGTTGAVPGCAPSLLEHPFANVPALAPALDRGWLYVATDYAGQATGGPHPYLIGEGEARSALDAVRAARQMQEVQLAPETVVWGHSQGGHAALWTGILAPTYAPELQLIGIAAAAPASDLRALVEAMHASPIGRILTSYVMQAYAATYADVRWDDYVTGPLAAPLARDLARRCLEGGQALYSAAAAMVLGGSIFAKAPTQGPLGERLEQNSPNRLLRQPLLVAQGEADPLVLPAVQARWVAQRCAAGQAIDFRRYAGLDHLTLVAADSPFSADLIRWTEDRFAGHPAASTCPP